MNLGFLNIEEQNGEVHIVKNPNTTCNLLGYIPGIGIAIGAKRIYDNINNPHASDKRIGIIRGICEMLGLGIIFLILDLIATCSLYISVQSQNINHTIIQIKTKVQYHTNQLKLIQQQLQQANQQQQRAELLKQLNDTQEQLNNYHAELARLQQVSLIMYIMLR